jgi:hypothetical protein
MSLIVAPGKLALVRLAPLKPEIEIVAFRSIGRFPISTDFGR